MTELADTVPAAGTLGHASRRSALRELLQYRQLVAMLVVRELKVRYKRSIFGLLWTLVNPLLLMVVYTVVFATIMKAPQRNFAIFLLSGLLPWLFFSIAVLQGLNSIIVNQELIRKVRLPQAVFPLSVVGSNLVNFVLSLFPLLLLMAVVGQPLRPALLFVPVAMLILTAFTSGVTLLFATFTVFFRDVRHLAEVALQMLMYLSPVFYDLQMLGHHETWWFRAFRLFLNVNPLWYLLQLVRDPVYYGELPPLRVIGVASAAALAALFVGFRVFNRLAPRHIHYL
jgi:lipopolysaccharide transport system permease protein